MSGILSALKQGYSEEDILGFLSKNVPGLKRSISKAQASGYGIKEILGYLSKNFETESTKGKTESQINAINNRADAERAKYGLKAAATAVAAPIAASAAQYAMSRALPNSLKNLTNSMNPKGVGSVASQPSQIPSSSNPLQSASEPTSQMPQEVIQKQNVSQQPPVNQVAPNISQPTQPVQAEGIINPKEFLEKAGVLPDVDRMLKEGNKPEAVAAALGLKNVKGKVQGKVDPELLKNIEEYTKTAQKQPELQEKIAFPGESAIDIQKRLKIGMGEARKLIDERDAKGIQKGQTVVTPNGLGQVKELRNGKALVEVDGKLQKINEEELEPPAFTDDEIADAYDDLMSKIPEEHKSGFISWAGYDEDRNVLGFIPRGGKYEELENITPEEAKMIKDGKGVARTTGETREGLWVVGEDTRGGVISQIIWDRKNKHKAEEEKQGKLALDLPKKEKEDKGMKPVFDEMAHARGLSREREKRAREAEKIRKKQEKDEAKKRKK